MSNEQQNDAQSGGHGKPDEGSRAAEGNAASKRNGIFGVALWVILGAMAALQVGLVVRRCDTVRPVGYLAPDFELPLIDRDTLPDGSPKAMKLSHLRGKVVVVDFWATWCRPCQQSMPALQRLYQKYRDRGFEIVSINIEPQNQEPQARAFRDRFGLTFPVGIDPGSIKANYRVSTIPHLFVIDRRGYVRSFENGLDTEQTFEKSLENKITAALASE